MLDIFHGEGLISLIKSVGYLGLFSIVFAESGLLVGAFLPGDSLLFTAGFLASQGYLNVWLLIVVLFIAAVLGDSVGYTFGRRVGRRIFRREDSLLFHKSNLEKAEAFYEKHGAITIVLARFITIVRTFAPIVAGVGKMNYSIFLMYNVVGGFLWTVSLTMAGYYLGKVIPNIDTYLLPIIALIVLISVLPPAIHVLKENRQAIKEAAARHLKRLRAK
ncbi:MAG: Inner membrane protein YqjA [bacterium ADurb.Bin400]|nr:MAG: Inner membrane protein YqjA [bacterium ADurb.Bin400]